MQDQESDRERRPRPKFGELAPEGWTWEPPKDISRLDTAIPLEPTETADAPPENSPPPLGQAGPPSAPTAIAAKEKAPPYWNRPVTFILLIIGLLGALQSVGFLTELPQTIQSLHAYERLGTYKAAPPVGTIILIGEIVQLVIWAVSFVISLTLVARRRLSFYVPLLAGVAGAVVLVACTALVLATDPVLLSSYSEL